MDIDSPIPVMVTSEDFKQISLDKIAVVFDGYIWVATTDGLYLYVLSSECDGELIPLVYRNIEEARVKVDLGISLERVDSVDGKDFDPFWLNTSFVDYKSKRVTH